jgi:hypothetical protein
LSLEGADGNREDEKKFEVAGSPKFIGEGDSVAGCDISVNDLCGRVFTLEPSKRSKLWVGSTLWRWGSGDITFACKIRNLPLISRRYWRNGLAAGGSARGVAAMGGGQIWRCVDVGNDVVPSV